MKTLFVNRYLPYRIFAWSSTFTPLAKNEMTFCVKLQCNFGFNFISSSCINIGLNSSSLNIREFSADVFYHICQIIIIMGYHSDTIVTKADRGPCENEGWLQDLLSVEEVVGDAVQEIAFPLKSKADNKFLGWMQDFKRRRLKDMDRQRWSPV